jgi:hypothetical protein
MSPIELFTPNMSFKDIMIIMDNYGLIENTEKLSVILKLLKQLGIISN